MSGTLAGKKYNAIISFGIGDWTHNKYNDDQLENGHVIVNKRLPSENWLSMIYIICSKKPVKIELLQNNQVFGKCTEDNIQEVEYSTVFEDFEMDTRERIKLAESLFPTVKNPIMKKYKVIMYGKDKNVNFRPIYTESYFFPPCKQLDIKVTLERDTIFGNFQIENCIEELSMDFNSISDGKETMARIREGYLAYPFVDMSRHKDNL
jgi:hypothetical protein